MRSAMTIGSLGALTLLVLPVQGQLDLSWYTIDGGGGTSTGGQYSLAMSFGQPDSGDLTGGGFTVHGGFWTVQSVGPVPCYPNCDGSAGSPPLTANDFQCFINAYAAGASYANCDGSSGTPALTANDFQCFINQYAAGCS